MCNFSGMIKNVLPSLRQRAGPQRICSRQKSIRSGAARDSFSQTPHVRGKDDEGRLKLRHVGITPAHAGKRRTPKQCVFNSRDHPRMCGEKRYLVWWWVPSSGSPPRMRGKVRAIVDAALEGGITPAYAGKRACCWGHPAAWGDHPRTCGEKSMYDYGNNTAQGSPPRMRGKDVASVIRNCTARITPACAGKRCARQCLRGT